MEPLKVNAPLNVSYFHTLHADTKGIITLATINPEADQIDRFKCRYGRYKTLCKEIEDGTENLYFSQNTFKKFSRRTENLFEITSCYIDIDYYNTDYTQEQILGNIDILIYDEEIPCPTFVIDSGRGLYLIWHLKRLPAEALPTWRTLQQYLYDRLKYLGADRKSLDAARVLRVDGSVNSKNNKKVQIITHYPMRYDLHQLEKKYIPEIYAYKKSKKSTQNKSKKQGTLLYYYNQ